MHEKKRKKFPVYLFWIMVPEAVGALASWLTRDGMELYNSQTVKPPLTPPPVVFPIAWGILYALMGFGAARMVLSPQREQGMDALQVFLLQLGVNFAWTIVFFGLRSYLGALVLLVCLFLLALWMTQRFHKADRLAAKLQLPYLLWLAFAAYLNTGVWLLNR